MNEMNSTVRIVSTSRRPLVVRRKTSAPRVVATLAGWMLGLGGGFSQAADPVPPPPVPAIQHLLPAGGQRGATPEILLHGVNLAGVSSLRFSTPQLAAQVVENADPSKVKIKVTIPGDAPLGEHELRVITPGGVSNCLRFVVGELPEMTEVEPNSELPQAIKLETLPVVANGQITGEDQDLYRFAAKAGQSFVFEVAGRRLRPFFQADERVGWFDPCLTLYDAQGKELRFVDDYRESPDPVLTHTFAQDGEYLVAVRDNMFRGRPEFTYRLTIGAVPFVTRYFPPGGKKDAEVKLQLTGVNIPGESLVKLTTADVGEQLWRVPQDGRNSNPLNLAVSELGDAVEQEPNDTRETAQRITAPTVLEARLEKPGDTDHYVFTAKKDERWVFESLSQRFGSPLDAVLQLLNAQGGQVAANDDTVAASESLFRADARMEYTIPADGDYIVKIRDFVKRGGDEFVYQLRVTHPRPDFTVQLKSTDPPLPNPRVTTVQTIAPRVPAGGQALFQVEASRVDGFGGDIQLVAEGLPEGFLFTGATIVGGQTTGIVTLSAPENAAVGTVVPLRIIGRTTVDGKEISRVAAATESHSYITDTRQAVIVKDPVISVSPVPSFRLKVDPAAATVKVEGKVELKVAVQRGTDVTGPVVITVQGLPPNVSAAPLTIAADQAEGVVSLTAAGNAAPVVGNIVILGEMTVGKDKVMLPSIAIPLTIAPK